MCVSNRSGRWLLFRQQVAPGVHEGIQIAGVRCVKAAGSATGGDATITVKSTANAITDAISLSGITAGLAKDASTYVPAYSGIPSGGILRITAAKSTGDAACTVIITGYRVA